MASSDLRERYEKDLAKRKKKIDQEDIDALAVILMGKAKEGDTFAAKLVLEFCPQEMLEKAVQKDFEKSSEKPLSYDEAVKEVELLERIGKLEISQGQNGGETLEKRESDASDDAGSPEEGL